jgi:hypothetical protein
VSRWTLLGRRDSALDQTIANLGNGVNNGGTGTVSVTDASSSRALAAIASTAFGFTATGNGAAPPSNIGVSS